MQTAKRFRMGCIVNCIVAVSRFVLQALHYQADRKRLVRIDLPLTNNWYILILFKGKYIVFETYVQVRYLNVYVLKQQVIYFIKEALIVPLFICLGAFLHIKVIRLDRKELSTSCS